VKAPAANYRIVTEDRGATWRVEEKATGKVQWHGATFRGARTAHARLELGISHRDAARMGNV
jgi:hypothetical protein